MMFESPRAIRHFGLAALEARARRTGDVLSAASPDARPTRAAPILQPPPPPKSRTVVRLWLPLTPLFLVLAPFALVLSPLVALAPRPYGDRPFATVWGVGALLLSLGGTVVDVEAPDAVVRIRIF